MDAVETGGRDLQALARERVRIGLAPDWIASSDYDPEFKPKIGGTLTNLLIERQVHAESNQTYIRTAVRLETAQAVQQQSQWRLQFEPQTQSVVLHSVKIRRGTSETEHVKLERLQFLRREAGLEGYVVDGWITLLLLLEDVRVADVLEWSFTITNQPRLLPEYVNSFFAVNPGIEVGKYYFSVRHAQSRTLRWKSSSPELAPQNDEINGQIQLVWTGERLSSPELENCLPGWQLAFPWIQISDCPDWQTLARGVSAAWGQAPAGEGLTELVNEIKSFSPILETQVNRALELVQDGFRYLSVNLELGGQIPAPLETVIRRRYGDCKDLSFLLVHLLHGLGVTARPVLVNAAWRKAIGDLLPASGVFDHAIVEFELGNEKRWVDATMKYQGGGAFGRCVPDFGLGLPLNELSTGLVAVPRSVSTAVWEVKESFVLDTAGQPSQLLVKMTGKGFCADQLRWEFANNGVETIAKNWLQNCATRFTFAKRLGHLQHHDEREKNEFVVSEAFEIHGFLKPDRSSNRCVFNLQSDITAGVLTLPSASARKHPFALPFPCHRVHTLEIDFSALRGLSISPAQVGNDFFTLSRRAKVLPNFLSITFTLEVRKECVPPDRVQEHRRAVDSAWRAATIQLLLPQGYSRRRGQIDLSQFNVTADTRAVNVEPGTTNEAKEGSWLREKLDERRRTQAVPQEVAGEQPPTEATQAVTENQACQGGRRRRGSRHADHRRIINKKCLLSVCVFLGTLAAFGAGGVLSHTPEHRRMAGVLFLVVISGMPCALVLAGLGLKECNRAANKYRGKEIAVSVLAVGSLLGLLFAPGVITGVNAVVDGMKARREPSEGRKLLKFEGYHCVFHAPSYPWAEVDARPYGGNSLCAFVRSGPMVFVGSARRLDPSLPDARNRVIEGCKADIRRSTSSSRVLKEGQANYAGLEGWEVEMEGDSRGQDYYYVQWLCISGSLAYDLVTWGPTALKEQIKDEAERMCSNFELLAPASQ